MRYLIVSPYPPVRDGIGSYALREAQALRAAGHDVEVLSPEPSAAHHCLDLRHPRAPFALARRLRRYDRVIIQFHPDLFYRNHDRNARAAANIGLILAFRWSGNVELRVHEWDGDPVVRGRWRDEITRSFFLSAQQITVHTCRERDCFSDFFAIPPARISVVDHGATFTRRIATDRAGARRLLGLPQDEFVFLCIGFLQEHKGFDRAVRAFSRLDVRGCRLDIVGSARVEDPAILGYIDHLRRLVEATPGTHLHEEYVSDSVFDCWIVAADAVVLPYRKIFSSSVLERAALYDRQLVLTRVGGLDDQAPEGSVFVDDDEQLTDAMAKLAGLTRAEVSDPWDPVTAFDIDCVMREIRRRAAAQRGRGEASTNGSEVTAPLRRISPLALPQPSSARPASALMKWVVRKATAWEIDPIIGQLNQLHRGLIEAFEHEHGHHDAGDVRR